MVFRDGTFDFRIGEKSMTPPALGQHLCRAMECTPGLDDIPAIPARLRVLDVQGVDKKLLFLARLPGLFTVGEMQNREYIHGLHSEAFEGGLARIANKLLHVDTEATPFRIQAMFDATSIENAQRIVGSPALQLFRME